MIERVTCFPNGGTPEVIPGEPQDGDIVRITIGNTVVYQRYSVPVSNAPPEFKTLTGSQFIAICAAALGFDRVDQLLAKSLAVSALIQKAEKVDRYSGNTPAAIQYLMTGDNALTQEELELIEDEWRAA